MSLVVLKVAFQSKSINLIVFPNYTFRRLSLLMITFKAD